MTPSSQDSSAATGRLEAIFTKRARRMPMDRPQSATLVAGQGIEGNADRGGKRQVTLIDTARWQDACAELGQEVDPATRRANLLLSGIDLRKSRGRILRIGTTRIEVRGETRPCRLMDDSVLGLMKALDPDWRAGAYGVVLEGGEITIGAEAAWDDE